jgi:hypothetical protein
MRTLKDKYLKKKHIFQWNDLSWTLKKKKNFSIEKIYFNKTIDLYIYYHEIQMLK